MVMFCHNLGVNGTLATCSISPLGSNVTLPYTLNVKAYATWFAGRRTGTLLTLSAAGIHAKGLNP